MEGVERAVAAGRTPLCLYSGGLDGTYLLHRLEGIARGRVFALHVRLERADWVEPSRLLSIGERFGAQVLFEDRVEEFANEFIVPAIQAQARYLGGHPLSASLSRPLMARAAVKVARDKKCDIILHTATRSQNSLRRFNGAIRSLRFGGLYGSPYEDGGPDRDEKIRSLRQAGLDGCEEREFSTDSNLWCREFEYGTADDPEEWGVPEWLYEWTRVSDHPAPQELRIRFDAGVPTALNGSRMSVMDMVATLNRLVGSYGLGRCDGLEECPLGTKVQEVREAPAAFLLLRAFRRIEAASLPAETIREKMHAEQLWVREAVEGRWFDPLRTAANAFITTLAKEVNGTVACRLSVGALTFSGVEADVPLYVRDRRNCDAQHAEVEARTSEAARVPAPPTIDSLRAQ